MHVRLICPGLFGFAGLDPAALPPTPALDRLLARADMEETGPRDLLETLAAEFGLVRPEEGDLPTAALCVLAEAPDLVGSSCWFHADPVHLRADRDRLLLFAGPSLGLSQDEAVALVAAFNAHFRGDGLHLFATRPDRWYLKVANPPDIRTEPLYQVTGRPVDGAQPRGPGGNAWARWQNEAQMLFFQHPLNRAREAAGRPTIGGLWTWGGGPLPQVSEGPDLIASDPPLGAGLARAMGGHRLGPAELSQSPSIWSSLMPESALIFWDGLCWPALTGDREAWCRGLLELEALADRLAADLALGPMCTLTLDDGESRRFRLTPWGLRRFWRRGGMGRWVGCSAGDAVVVGSGPTGS